jgi:5'(3')-deoxyribonucleotidase
MTQETTEEKDFRILLDVDGVLGDFIGYTLSELATAWEPNEIPARKDFQTWDLFNTITNKHQQKYCNRFWRYKGWCRSIPVLPGAVEAVDRLRRHGEVYAVTAPLSHSLYWMGERYEWLKENFRIPPENVIFAYDKGVVSGHVFLDDKPANIDRWSCMNAGRALLWSTGYNQNDCPDRAVRVHDWEEVITQAVSEKVVFSALGARGI